MSLTLALGSAVSGLLTAQQGLDLTSNNISNANTEGYTRKQFNPVSVVLNGHGSGVKALDSTRVVDAQLQQNMRQEGSVLNALQISSDYYARIQDLFGTPGQQNSISSVIASLGQNMESLALNPDTSTNQATAVDSASMFAQKLNSMAKQIQDLRRQADSAINLAVTEANGYLTQIADLNDKISRDIAIGANASDLQDKRDLALKNLSGLMDVQMFTRENGAVTVYTMSGTSLIDNGAVLMSHPSVSQVSPEQTKAGGDFSGIMVGSVDVTAEIRQGKFKGLIDLRDGILPNLQSELDQMMVVMRDQVNVVHNRGTPFPLLANNITGTRTFMPVPGVRATDPAQTIKVSNGDVAITIFDANGKQMVTTTLNTIMQKDMSTAPSQPQSQPADNQAQGSGADWSINSVARHIQGWLNTTTPNGGAGLPGATVALDAKGKLAINLNTASVGITFRDQASSTPGDVAQDVTVQFNSDGDFNKNYDETVQGFSNFFGLNDFFVTPGPKAIWDTAVLTRNATIGTNGTLAFSDRATGINVAGLTVNQADTVKTLAARINADPAMNKLFVAQVVPDGGGYRLRIKNLAGRDMMITQTDGNNLMTAMGFKASNSGAASHASVRPDLAGSPALVSRGTVQYNTDLKQYYVSAGDNTTVNQLAGAFSGAHAFNSAGSLMPTTRSFSDYAATIISQNASDASTVRQTTEYQSGLVTALSQKVSSASGVNLDQELANIMMFQQSYAAAAKVIVAAQAMLDTLNNLIR
ncbi:MAG: flagellar hook-associated protein FlgK [Alphaproteobacteria bacterium]